MAKRNVPDGLQYLLQFDIYVTNVFCKLVEKIYPLQKCRSYFTALEVSCHGIPWIVVWLGSIWVLWKPSLFEMQVNFFIGLIIDLVAVSCVKAITRRRRPPNNRPDMLLAVGPDKFSFPSGHASRACYVTYFFTWLYPINPLLTLLLWSWNVAISLSRILMRRHYVLDVLGGVALGIVETFFVYYIWFSHSTCVWLISWLTEEDVDDGEYADILTT